MTLFTETLPPADQPYPVPENWVWVKLGEIVQINPPKHKPNISEEELCSFLPMSAISEESGSISTIEEQPYQKVKTGYTSFQENDVLFAKITPCMENGKAAIARNLKHGFGFGSTEFFVLRCSQRILNQFLYYFVRSKSFRDEAQPNMTGSVGQKRVPRKFLSDYHFPLSPLPEQRRIAAKLDALLGKLREARTLMDEARESFALRRAAILHQAFSGKLTAQWRAEHRQSESKKVKLNEVSLTIKIGPFGSMLHKADYITGGIPLINPVHIKGQKITSDLDFTVSQEKCIELSEYVLAENDIIMGRRGEMGRCALITKIEHGRLCGTGSLFIRPDKVIYPQYLFYALNSNDVKSYLKASSQGSTMDNLNLKIIKNIEIPLPPLEEQREIVRQLDSLLGHETDAAALLDMDDELDLLEQSILSRAFRGELGTNDPAEPPAI